MLPQSRTSKIDVRLVVRNRLPHFLARAYCRRSCQTSPVPPAMAYMHRTSRWILDTRIHKEGMVPHKSRRGLNRSAEYRWKSVDSNVHDDNPQRRLIRQKVRLHSKAQNPCYLSSHPPTAPPHPRPNWAQSPSKPHLAL